MKKIILKTAIVVATFLFNGNVFGFTAVTSGAWSNAATWGGVGPGSNVTGQDVIIPLGINVDMDLDVNFTGAANSFMVNGTLTSITNKNLWIGAGSFSGNGSTTVRSLTFNSALTTYSGTGSISVEMFSNQGATIPLSTSVSVSDSLDLSSGSILLNTGASLNIATNASICVDNAVLVAAGGLFYAPSPYNLYYIGTTKTMGVEANSAYIQNVEINLIDNAEDIVISDDHTINGNLNLATGHIRLNGNSLSLKGDYTGGAGAQFETTNSILIIDGPAGPLTRNIDFSSGSTLSHLTIDRTVTTFRLESDVIITDSMHLLNGTLRLLTGGNIIMSAGAVVDIYDGVLFPTGGTFDGTLQYNVYYSGPSYTTGLELSGSGLNDVTVNLYGAGMIITMGDDVVVNGRFYLQRGMWNLGTSRLTLNGTFDHGTNGKFQGSALAILHLHLTAVVNDTISFDPNLPAMAELIVENPLGSVVVLGSNVSIHDQLIFIRGKVDVGDGQLTIGTVASIAGNNDTNYVVTSGIGSLRMYITNSTAFKMFPVGTMSSYSPASLQQVDTGSTGYMMIRVMDGVYTGGSSGANIATWAAVVNRTWIVDADPTVSIVSNVRAYWTAAAEVNGFDRNSAYLTHYSNWAWDSDTASAAIAGPNGTYRMTRSDGFLEGGEFAVVDSSVPLGVNEPVAGVTQVYPVPTSDVLYLKLGNEYAGGNVQYEMYDAAGNLVEAFTNSNTMNQIDMTSYSNGYYIMRMVFSDGTFVTKKVVKS